LNLEKMSRHAIASAVRNSRSEQGKWRRRRLLPGWSSADGGIEEFPLFRETSLSSRAI
jgi:hypothetical protein